MILSDKSKSWLILIALSVIWGSSFILIKKGLIAFTPIQVACLRVSISSLSFLPVLLIRWKKIDWSKFKYFAIVGLAGSGIPAFLFAFAQTEINSTMAGILNSLTPLFTFVLGLLIFGLAFSWSKMVGVVVGLAGAAVLIFYGSEAGMQGNFRYAILVIFATMCYATSANVVGTFLKEIRSLTISAVAFSIVGLPAVIMLFSTDFLEVMQSNEYALASLGYVSILAVMGTVIASAIFFYLVHLTNPVFASMIAYLIPIVALGWGFLDGETVTIFHFLGMALILSGIYLSKSRKTKNQKEEIGIINN